MLPLQWEFDEEQRKTRSSEIQFIEVRRIWFPLLNQFAFEFDVLVLSV